MSPTVRMTFDRVVSAIRGWRPRPVTGVALVLLLGVVGGCWWAFGDDGRSPDQRVIDAGRYAGARTRTDRQILEVADNICASLRHDHSLVSAHGMAGRQLLLEGKDPRRWQRFIYAAIDNRCPDADDVGLIDNDEGRLNRHYRWN